MLYLRKIIVPEGFSFGHVYDVQFAALASSFSQGKLLWCLYAAGSSSEVSSCNEEVAGLDFLVEFGVEPVHCIFCHLDRVVGARLEPKRYDDVRIHIVRPDPCSAPDNRGRRWEAHRYLLGSAICPSKADAAAVAGMRGRFWRLWRPFVPHNFAERWRD